MKYVAFWVFGMLIALNFISWFAPYDTTDDSVNEQRSHLTLFTDYGTGCQYISAGLWNGVTPRLNAEGTPLCNPDLMRKAP